MERKNVFSILAFVFSLCVWLVGAIFGVITSVVSLIPILNIILAPILGIISGVAPFALFVLAIVFGIIGLKSKKKGFSIAALIICGVQILLALLAIVVVVILAIAYGAALFAMIAEIFGGIALLPLLLI